MAVTTATSGAQAYTRGFKITRQFVLGVVFAIVGVVFFISALSISGDIRTILFFEAGSLEEVPHVTVPTQAFILATSVIYVLSGVLAVATSQDEQRARWGTYALYFCGILIIPLILVAAAADKQTNAIVMLSESLRLATPIAIGALAGLWCERSGVVNIAIEGMMLFGACTAFTAFFYLRQEYGATHFIQFVSVMVAVMVGGLTAVLHAWLSITFKINQIVSGTVINILSVGATSFIRREYLLSTEAGFERLPNIRIPLLAEIPIIGEPLFNNQPIFYMMFVLIIVSHVALFHTRWGLRVRAVGENPHAADTLGIKVNRVRWISVFIGGLIAGLAGSWLSMEATGRFNAAMTSGRGFIALAALIFGKWTPFGAFGGALLFGFADALGTRLQLLGVDVPSQFLQMVPYVTTIIVLAGLIGRAVAPKASGQPYEKEKAG